MISFVRFISSLLTFSISLGLGIGLICLSTITVSALFGFLWPLADALNHFQPVWFIGLALLLILSLIFVPKWMARSQLILVGFVGLIAACVPLVGEYSAAALHFPVRDSGRAEVRIMSHNLFGKNYDMQRVTDAIARENPDVLAFQEYFSEQRSRLHPLIIEEYPFYSTCIGGRRSAIAIYSRIPFTASELSVCPANIGRFDGDVARIIAEFSGDDGYSAPWTLVTTHLNWPIRVSVLSREEFTWSEKLDAMSARKQLEWQELTAAIQAIEGDAVLVGDLNSTPWSYNLRNFVTAAGMRRYSLNMPTYPMRLSIGRWRDTIPFLPLDHFMTKGDIAVYEIATGQPAGSDHLPIVADIALGL